MADLDGKLASMNARIEKLDTKVATTRASCTDFGRRFGWWTVVTAVMLTVTLAWFGISQIVMMGYGWRRAKAR